jgi:hypothetical protein
VSTVRSASVGLKVLVALTVAAVTATGVWVTGGLITNDFELAMALTTAWLVLTGVVCAAIAWRRRRLAVAVLGAYLLTAGAIGIAPRGS